MLSAFLLFAMGFLQAPAPAKPIETPHLTIATAATPAAAGKVSLTVDVTPKPKMHVYSPGQADYIVTTLTLEPNSAFTAAKTKYPDGEKYYMEALKETQLVYSKPFKITQDITLKPGAKNVTVKGTLRYQACDDKICYLPKNVPVQWTVK
jgi:DsbC/DsbD-like thiol-disulfide interchange protein